MLYYTLYTNNKRPGGGLSNTPSGHGPMCYERADGGFHFNTQG